jgi:hypothetical protein
MALLMHEMADPRLDINQRPRSEGWQVRAGGPQLGRGGRHLILTIWRRVKAIPRLSRLQGDWWAAVQSAGSEILCAGNRRKAGVRRSSQEFDGDQSRRSRPQSLSQMGYREVPSPQPCTLSLATRRLDSLPRSSFCSRRLRLNPTPAVAAAFPQTHQRGLSGNQGAAFGLPSIFSSPIPNRQPPAPSCVGAALFC